MRLYHAYSKYLVNSKSNNNNNNSLNHINTINNDEELLLESKIFYLFYL
jgi:hypothetical protein